MILHERKCDGYGVCSKTTFTKMMGLTLKEVFDQGISNMNFTSLLKMD